jgi:hypothetical protein
LTLCNFDRAVPTRHLPDGAGSLSPVAVVTAHLTTQRLRFGDGGLRTGRSRSYSSRSSRPSRNTTYCVRAASLCPARASRQEIAGRKTVRLFYSGSISYEIVLTIFHCDFFAAENPACRDYPQHLVSPAIPQVMHTMPTFLLTGCPSKDFGIPRRARTCG